MRSSRSMTRASSRRSRTRPRTPAVPSRRRTASACVTPPGSVLLPGLVDLHIHAPQWPQLGTGLDLPLERWLFEYTFPLEARYADLAFARAGVGRPRDGLLAHGTTTAVYFATVDVAATTALAEAAAHAGQRAYVAGSRWTTPTARRPGTATRMRPRASPRAPDPSTRSGHWTAGGRSSSPSSRRASRPPAPTSCSAASARSPPRPTRSSRPMHRSRTGHTPTRSSGSAITDCAALDAAGLLRPGTVLHHANHVTDADASLLVARGAGIAHCPLSNAYFANAVLPTRRLVERGVRMGLGTDVSGGASPSLLHTVHEAVTVLADPRGRRGPRPAAERARRPGLGDRHDVRLLARDARGCGAARGAGRAARAGTPVRRGPRRHGLAARHRSGSSRRSTRPSASSRRSSAWPARPTSSACGSTAGRSSRVQHRRR